MIIVIILLVIIVVFVAISTGPKNNVINGVKRGEFEINISEYPESYVFEVAGVHLDHFMNPIINYCKVKDVIVLEPEPNNKFDEDAILVKNSYYEIGYVPSTETYDVHEIINKKHVAYVSQREIMGYIKVEITIRYSN